MTYNLTFWLPTHQSSSRKGWHFHHWRDVLISRNLTLNILNLIHLVSSERGSNMFLTVFEFFITGYGWILLQTLLQWTDFHKLWTSWHQSCCLVTTTSFMTGAANVLG
jgi:hypothetical protein